MELQRTGAAIDEKDEVLLKEWLSQQGIKTVLEFGPGLSTKLFADLGLAVDSIEMDRNYFQPNHDLPGCHMLLAPGNTVEGLASLLHPCSYISSWYDLGFVDGPNGYSAPLARLLPALFAAERCRVLILHDTNRPDEQTIVQVLRRRGWKTYGERTEERGMICLVRS